MELTAAEDGSSGTSGDRESAERTPQRQRGVRSSSGSTRHARLHLARGKQRSVKQQLLELRLVEVGVGMFGPRFELFIFIF